MLTRRAQGGAASIPTTPASTTSVRVDGSVLLKIVRHVSEAHPGPANGQLLGVEDENDSTVLRVTHTFALPANMSVGDNDGARSRATNKYVNDMVSLLREVNVEPNTIGWYTGGPMGRFVSPQLVEGLLSAQSTNREAVVIVYDAPASHLAGFGLRAYRLSPQYLAARKEGRLTSENLTKNNLSYKNVLVELPVTVENSHLATMFLHSASAGVPENDYEDLALPGDTYLERSVEGLFDTVEDFYYDQGNYSFYQRQVAREQAKISQWQQKRKSENATRVQNGQEPLSTEEWKSLFKLPEEPSRADALLISSQLDRYCEHIEGFGPTVTSKLFAAQKTLLDNA